MIALTKTADERDYPELAEELAIVDQHFTAASEQHPMRRWEYALALRALQQWAKQYRRGAEYLSFLDVGGAGSPFLYMPTNVILGPSITVLDPTLPSSNYLGGVENDPDTGFLYYEKGSLEWYIYESGNVALFDGVFCLSVIEHVPDDDVDRFVYHLSSLVAPGGLLFLTMDACDHDRHALDVPDPHHFSWMRSRIYGPQLRGELGMRFLQHHFQLFGGIDRTYHGPTVYDYTFASLCLQKRS
jgi:SAM-dependent methyltransferase